MTNEQRSARDRIRDVVMRLIANISDEARGLESARDAEDVTGSALAIAADAAEAQVAILAICNDLRHGATPL